MVGYWGLGGTIMFINRYFNVVIFVVAIIAGI